MVKVCIRDDDIGYYEPCITEFLDVFTMLGIKLNLEAVPCRIFQNRYMIKLLESYIKTDLFEVHCHGFSHTELYKDNLISEYHFKDLKETEKELILGKQILKDAFGLSFEEYFTAPWENLSDDSIKLVKKYYKDISGKRNQSDLLYVDMDFRIRDKNGPRWKTLKELTHEFDSLDKSRGVVVLRIHHYLYMDSDKSNLKTLHDFLCVLREIGVEFCHFSEINNNALNPLNVSKGL